MNPRALEQLVRGQLRYLDCRGVTEDVDKPKGLIRSVISTSGLDEHSTSHAPYSMKKSLPQFRKTGTVLWRHGRDMTRGDLPVGHPTGGFPKYRKEGHELETLTRFDIEADAFAALVFHKYAVGDLSQWSAGFLPEVVSERAQHKGQQGPTFLEAALREYSALPLGSNPDTTTEAVRELTRCLAGVTGEPGGQLADPEGFIQERVQEALQGDLGLPIALAQNLSELTLATILCSMMGIEGKDRVAAIRAVPNVRSADAEEHLRLWGVVDRNGHLIEGGGENRGAVKKHTPRPAPEDANWNLTEREIQGLPDEAFGWLDPAYLAGDDEKKLEGRRFPHHDVEGNVVWRGVAMAMSDLRGTEGRGLPEKDRMSVYQHLVEHFEQFGRQAPSLSRELAEQVTLDGFTPRQISEVVGEVKAYRDGREQRRNATGVLVTVLEKLLARAAEGPPARIAGKGEEA